MSKFKNHYRIESSRLQNWNYAWKGLYFVTINTKFFKEYFGKIANEEINLSAIGEKVYEEWLNIPGLRPDMNIILDEFQIMPNHFHGIIGIGRNEHNAYPIVEKQCIVSPPDIHLPSPQNAFGPQRKNLGSIIRGFKGSVTSFAKENELMFNWHPRFHDSLIKDEIALENIRNYIRNNVKNWKKK